MIFMRYTLCPHCKHNESLPVKDKEDTNICLKCGKEWTGKLYKIFSVKRDKATNELKFIEITHD